MMAMRILIFGYGNPDREDDGVAWHILARLATLLGQPIPDEPEEPFPSGQTTDIQFALQLTPDVAELIAEYDAVWFVDAHTGQVPEDLHIEKVQPVFQRSPFTHHFTPQSCLSLAQALYQKMPFCELVSVRGYMFGFQRRLSAQTEILCTQAADYLFDQVSDLGKSQ